MTDEQINQQIDWFEIQEYLDWRIERFPQEAKYIKKLKKVGSIEKLSSKEAQYLCGVIFEYFARYAPHCFTKKHFYKVMSKI